MNDLGALYTRIEADTSNLNKAEGKIKSFAQKTEKTFDQAHKSTKRLELSIGSLTRSIAILSGGFLAAEGVAVGFFNEFKNGLKAVEDFNVTVASSAAFMATFSEKASLGDMAAGYRESLVYAEQLANKLEMIDTKTIASGKDLQVISETMLQQGVLLDINNKKQVDGFTNIATALALVTAGQNKDIQMRQEINALLMGQIRATDRLPKLLKAIDPQLEDHIKLWKSEGTVIENVGELLKGFSADTGTLENLWATVGSTMETIHTRILRGAFKPIFSDLIGLAKKLNSTLMDSSGNLTPVAESIQKNIVSFYDSIKGLAKEYGGELLALTSALVVVKGAQLAFNLAAKANPYILAATALVFLAEKVSGYNITTKDAIQITGNFARSISGMMAVASGKISFFEYATSGAKELEVLLNDEVKRIDEAIEKIKNRKEPWSLLPDPAETKRRAAEDQAAIERLTKARESAVAATKTSVQDEARAVEMAKRKEEEALQRLTEEYEKHRDAIFRINDEIKQNQMTGEQLIRDLKRETMSKGAAEADIKKEAQEYLALMEKAKTTWEALKNAKTPEDTMKKDAAFEDIIKYSEVAQSKYLEMDRTSGTVKADVIKNIQAIVSARDSALKASKQVEVDAANNLIKESDGAITAQLFEDVKTKANEITAITYPEMGKAFVKVWQDGEIAANTVFTNIDQKANETAVKIGENLWVVPKGTEFEEPIKKIEGIYKNVYEAAKTASDDATKSQLKDNKLLEAGIKEIDGVWSNTWDEASKAAEEAIKKMLDGISKVKSAAASVKMNVGGSVQGKQSGGAIQRLKDGGMATWNSMKAIHASVGKYFPGFGGGDKIPILGEAGEHMINKYSVREAGRDTADAFNKRNWAKVVTNLLPKIQTGGPNQNSFPQSALSFAGLPQTSSNIETSESVRKYYIGGEAEPIILRADDRNSERLLSKLDQLYRKRSKK